MRSHLAWPILYTVRTVGRTLEECLLLVCLPLNHILRFVSKVSDLLLEIPGDETIESKRNLFRFYNYVKFLLPHYDVNIMLQASKTLGHVASIGGAAFGEQFMNKELPAAIMLVENDKQEFPRYAGVLILKELARNSPVYFHAHISLVFEKILVPLRDTRVIVREGAAELLAACLEIIDKRERAHKSPYLFKIYQDAQLGLKTSQPHVVHGSLLTYRELLLHGGMVRKCSLINNLRYSTDECVTLVHERNIPGYGRTDLAIQIR